jgi:hypothetical protein
MTYQIITSAKFDAFFDAVKTYCVELYLIDDNGEQIEGFTGDDLSRDAEHSLLEVTRLFWSLGKRHINVFLTDGNKLTRQDRDVLDQFGCWFVAAFGGHGISFTDTSVDVERERDGVPYDGDNSQEQLEILARYFFSDCGMYVEDNEVQIDLAPCLQLRWAQAGSSFNEYPTLDNLK